jgi:hypothetical protein
MSIIDLIDSIGVYRRWPALGGRKIDFSEDFMKKRALLGLFLGLMAIAGLAFTACKEKGGTIEVTNETSYASTVSVGKGLIVIPNGDNTKVVAAGSTETWNFDEDGTYAISALSIGGSSPLFTKTVNLLGGNSERVTLK